MYMSKVKETIYRCSSRSLCEVLLRPCHINLPAKTKRGGETIGSREDSEKIQNMKEDSIDKYRI